jgi:hypothetical protein
MDEELRMWTEVCVASSADDPAAAAAIQHTAQHTHKQVIKNPSGPGDGRRRGLGCCLLSCVWAGPKGRCSGGLYWKSRMTG